MELTHSYITSAWKFTHSYIRCKKLYCVTFFYKEKSLKMDKDKEVKKNIKNIFFYQCVT